MFTGGGESYRKHGSAKIDVKFQGSHSFFLSCYVHLTVVIISQNCLSLKFLKD